ncbi:MAG: hypothetical protein H6630_00025 [Arcobacter sp.]|nr:hypothetical protein [Arcobacter sp.]
MLHFKEPCDLAINFKNLTKVDSFNSNLQKIVLFKHLSLGKILVINNEVQHVERWSPFYHEMVTHLPISFIPNIKNVLILGGGSLYAASEILKYPTIRKIDLVDHDKSVIDMVVKYYPHAQKAHNDKRLNIFINDAFLEIEQSCEKYDLIINDSVDLIEHGRTLSKDLIKILCEKLSENGICSDLIYRHIFEEKTIQRTFKKLRGIYYSNYTLITIPEYPGIFHILCFWSNTNKYLEKTNIRNITQKQWMRKSMNPFLFYNPNVIKYYLYKPPYLKTYTKAYNYT